MLRLLPESGAERILVTSSNLFPPVELKDDETDTPVSCRPLPLQSLEKTSTLVPTTENRQELYWRGVEEMKYVKNETRPLQRKIGSEQRV